MNFISTIDIYKAIIKQLFITLLSPNHDKYIPKKILKQLELLWINNIEKNNILLKNNFSKNNMNFDDLCNINYIFRKEINREHIKNETKIIKLEYKNEYNNIQNTNNEKDKIIYDIKDKIKPILDQLNNDNFKYQNQKISKIEFKTKFDNNCKIEYKNEYNLIVKKEYKNEIFIEDKSDEDIFKNNIVSKKIKKQNSEIKNKVDKILKETKVISSSNIKMLESYDELNSDDDITEESIDESDDNIILTYYEKQTRNKGIRRMKLKYTFIKINNYEIFIPETSCELN